MISLRRKLQTTFGGIEMKYRVVGKIETAMCDTLEDAIREYIRGNYFVLQELVEGVITGNKAWSPVPQYALEAEIQKYYREHGEPIS
jgi:hypothetical protein